MSTPVTPWKIWARAGLDVFSSLGQMPSWLRLSHEINDVSTVGDDFIGVNIATSSDPRCDDQVLNYLKDLGVRHVRMDYSYCSQGGDAQRLLDRVLAENIDVMLDLFPPLDQAEALASDDVAQQNWTEFLNGVFRQYENKVSVFEIGSTPNRGKWSGFDGVSYLQAWRLAAKAAESFSVTLAGPNISDFEPLYNFSYLKAMKRIHSVPKIHTDNLFVERVIQPEAYDHRVAGAWATRKLNLNLIKKARIIHEIGQKLGCEKTYCSYKCWTRKRLSRWTADPEQKNADYMLRYLVIAAASGALDRVYWGPLICNRDGLVDCGDNEYPVVDNVSFYKEVRGDVDNFKPSKAYVAFKYAVVLMRDVTCLQGVSADNGINHFVFENKQGEEFHVVWCLDKRSIPLSHIYSDACLAEAEFTTGYGEAPGYRPAMLSEQPLVITWSKTLPSRPSIDDIRTLDDVAASGVLYHLTDGLQSIAVNKPQWQGVVAVAHGADVEQTLAAYMPSSLTSFEELKVLRDTRNRLWNICLDEQRDEIQTVKLNRAKGIKKFTYRFMDSKGMRHWNNATEMLRRGINTPQPLAFFERHNNSGIEDNYYVCRFIPGAFSARDVFLAFNQGAEDYKGISKHDMFDQMSAFIAHMHDRGVIHRDLSSGNLMMTFNDGELKFYAIDIGRAVIDVTKGVKPRHRFVDLKRICYKLGWPDRELFIEAYNKHQSKALPNSWRLSIFSYEFKQTAKKMLKGKYKRKKK